ncbi:hypothetical protein GN244_ATG12941 [Phytophthora infestans]|uniref:Uncharacterized protein n=1 Tax=Phytophthora infestans TaxID=4787 RepID=A0A833WAR4_PHYIN|nr:hypothetical protein GN244_ATG12941 [Phytophthora infestans]
MCHRRGRATVVHASWASGELHDLPKVRRLHVPLREALVLQQGRVSIPENRAGELILRMLKRTGFQAAQAAVLLGE